MMDNSESGRSVERIIDGMQPEPVVMVKSPVITPSCAPGKHCACHGDGPYFCCKCGAHFMPAEE